MIIELVKKWEENKSKLEDYFSNTSQAYYDEYEAIVVKLFELVLEGYKHAKFDTSKIKVINDGDYQGTLLFIIPLDCYQPSVSDYFYTYVDYGSCSGCDTLQAITDEGYGIPTTKQVNDYMKIALHLVQNIKRMGE